MSFIRNTLCAIVLAAGLAGCEANYENPIKTKVVYAGKIDNKKVSLFMRYASNFFSGEDMKFGYVLGVYNDNEKMVKAINDSGCSGRIGDNDSDSVFVYHEDGSITEYNLRKTTINRNGESTEFSHNSSELNDVAKEEFRQADELYQRVLKAAVGVKTK